MVLFLPCTVAAVGKRVVNFPVRGTRVPVDGEPEVRGQLQSPPGADGETRGVVCQFTEDRPADGFPQRVLRSSQTSGTRQERPWPYTGTCILMALMKARVSFCLSGLLRSDSVSDRDRHPGSPYPADPSVVSEGHLPARICSQRPGLDESQVS